MVFGVVAAVVFVVFVVFVVVVDVIVVADDIVFVVAFVIVVVVVAFVVVVVVFVGILIRLLFLLALYKSCFHLLFYQGENVSSRVRAVHGDIELPGLGLSDEDKETLSSQVVLSFYQICLCYPLSFQ